MNFYKEIQSNQRKTYILLVFFSLIVILLGAVIGMLFIGSYLFGMVIAFIIAILYSFLAYQSGDSMILGSARAKELKKEDDPYLFNLVEGLAISAQIPKPKIYLINEESMNAFATGKDPKHASIAVTSGLRKRMNRLELEGVISHEMSHIKNYDIRVMMLVTVLLGVVVLLSDIIFRSFIWAPRNGRSESKGQGALIFLAIAIVLAILAPIVAQLMRLAISRKREYLADATGAKLTHYPKGLADALEKIKNDHDVTVDTANKATAHLYIENPLREKKGFMVKLFSTHPDINDRIKKLRLM